jgi:hypothetical protein
MDDDAGDVEAWVDDEAIAENDAPEEAILEE